MAKTNCRKRRTQRGTLERREPPEVPLLLEDPPNRARPNAMACRSFGRGEMSGFGKRIDGMWEVLGELSEVAEFAGALLIHVVKARSDECAGGSIVGR